MKSLPTEIPVKLPKTIIGMLGGMMIPMLPEATMIALENSRL